ncbi:MAG: radical SAM protein [Planctomycetota bacterium]
MGIEDNAVTDSPRFTFIIPNTAWFGKRYWHNFPYTEALLAAVLRQRGFRVDIIDANIRNLSEADLEAAVRDNQPEVVGIGEMALEYKDCVHKSFEIAKRACPTARTVVGGIYPTLSPEIATQDGNIDYFVFGEGEERLPALLEAIRAGTGFERIDGLAYRKDGTLVTNPRPHAGIPDLDALPMPDYTGFDMKRYSNYQQRYTQNFSFKQLPVAQTITSRGCPFKCTFCCSRELYDLKIRTRSPRKVLEEVDMLVEQHGIREIIFVDDSLLWPKDRALEIMNGLIERRQRGIPLIWKSNNLAIHHMEDEIIDKMKESGCYSVIVSIESGCRATLKRMKKPVNLNKVIEVLEKVQKRQFDDVSSNFVIGMPGDTWEDIRETFRYVEHLVDRRLLDYAVFHICTPLPKTEVYEICRKEGYLPKDYSFENPDYYGFGHGVITTPEFTPGELQILRAYEWDRINFKTEEQRARVARMLHITLEELDAWRLDTRRSVGLRVQTVDRLSANC